ncbi:hypothetical protein BT96DRAFT_349721 [Gymnopus androsaceus JB14]|uniref:DUF6534 domain-containing protein n=1 Tax=Gymnopus androsaceus JB14 TaxID=1447944 RepID=A0A6A4GXX6_9AGAR|nr:hypothetical protein BT96DRAFT_349721 [Gymnopus androsaceus JB14]
MAETMNSTFGLLFNAVVVGAALYGVGCLQGWMYFRKYQNSDPWYLKSLVGFILLCDTFQMGILTACIYKYIILNFANEEILGTLFNTLIIEIFFSDAIGLSVQMFYCWRIWRLSQRNYFVVLPLVLLSWAAFTSLFVYSCLALKFSTFAELATLKNLSMSCNILAAASDIFISAAMVLLLQKSKTGYKSTNGMLNRLIIFTFNTGIPGRFYTNSLLVTLNFREYIKKGAAEAATSYMHDDESGSGIAIRIDTTRRTDIQFSTAA